MRLRPWLLAPLIALAPLTAAAQSKGAALAPTEDLSGPLTIAGGTAPAPRPQSVTRLRVQDGAGREPSPQGGDAATLLADRVDLTGDRKITASGGVEVWYRGARLTASRIRYDGTGGVLTIDGPIRLIQPGQSPRDEALLIADQAELSEDLQNGILRGARLVLAREMQMAAQEITRSDGGRITTLSNVVASSCQVCASDPTPLWEIRARKITHDADRQRLYFDQPQFRAFGLPIAMLPALSAPDPTATRATGFLRPQVRTTSRLGFGIKLPYFIALGDHADLTLTPYLSAKGTQTLDTRWRQAFHNGEMEWKGALSRDNLEPGSRGYLFGAGRFELPRDYVFGFQVQTASDRAYLLDYGITSADRLWSGVTLDRVRRDRMVVARIGRYETLREDEDNATQPGAVADVVWQRRFQPALIGGEGGLEWSVHTHRRPSSADRSGRDLARASVTLDWRRGWVLPGGVLAAAQAEIAADAYAIRQDSRYEPTVTRIDPVAAVELRWPLARSANGATDLIEPVLQIVMSPRHDHGIPNEDSRLLEFDEGNLFALGRFPGRDLRESGLRANLGIGWTRINPEGWQIGLTAGRVLRAREGSGFEGSGPLAGRNSDWMVAAHYSGSEGLSIANRALFDDSLTISRNETRLGWAKPGFQLSAGYLWLAAAPEESREADVSELTFETGWQITDGWWGSAEGRYDFAANQAQRASLGLQYTNECVTVDLAVSRRFTATADLSPETDFNLAVRLGGFGGTQNPKGVVARRSCVR